MLQEAADNLVVVIEFVVGTSGHVQSDMVYRAVVRNTAQLTTRNKSGDSRARRRMRPFAFNDPSLRE
jgi:hypothetical protein